jgi:hypothetical protein
MLNNLIAILGLAALCAIWAGFQIWVAQYAPEKMSLKAGCSSCHSGNCDNKASCD